MGKRHGHATVYFYNGDIFNMKYEKGKKMSEEKVSDNSKAWFGDGQPLRGK